MFIPSPSAADKARSRANHSTDLDRGGPSSTVVRRGTVLCLLIISAGCGDPTELTQERSAATVGTVNVRHERLALGYTHGCYVHDDGSLWCWGRNDAGQLGQGTQGAPSPLARKVGLPVRINEAIVEVGAGEAMTCALDVLGQVWCFGSSANGELGRRGPDPTINSAWPEPELISRPGPYVHLTVGGGHACALDATGGLFCWGSNLFSQLGAKTRAGFSDAPLYAGGPFVDVVAGFRHTCALRSDRRVECWGSNTVGELGDGTYRPRRNPLPVLDATTGGAPLEEVESLAGGQSHTCALKLDGRVLCWGDGVFGELGTGGFQPNATMAIESKISGAISLGGGGSSQHTCAVLSDGSAQCWGTDRWDELGAGAGFQDPGPVLFQMASWLPQSVLEMATGLDETCARVVGGSVLCAGRTQDEFAPGQFADIVFQSPLNRGGIPTTSAGEAIALGYEHTCAIRGDQSLYCWGSNINGEVGNGTPSGREMTPIHVPLKGVKDVAAGRGFTCAIDGKGAVYCWGKNDFGQLGSTPGGSVAAPALVAGLSGAVTITAGERHACALLAGGLAQCWGDNGDGQLGDGTLWPRVGPVTPYYGAFGSLSKIVAGSWHTCAIDYGGQAVCWGSNIQGQLGDGTTMSATPGVPVAAIGRAVDIAAGRSHTCALTQSASGQLDGGEVWCWGGNSNGQLGDGTTAQRLTSVRALSGATGIAAGGNHSCAVRGGVLLCFGENMHGQVGDGTSNDRSSPVLVNLAPGVRAVATGNRHTCALDGDGVVSCWGANSYGQVGIGLWSGSEPSPAAVIGFP